MKECIEKLKSELGNVLLVAVSKTKSNEDILNLVFLLKVFLFFYKMFIGMASPPMFSLIYREYASPPMHSLIF